jgi:WD40 repeat protein
MSFDGFISYSHAADGRLAPAVQRGLHRLAKPWHRRRALWIFRDQTGLSVTPALWSSIQTALDGSQWFVLLASPEAARSPWVNREIEHWIATKPANRILPVVTDGEWRWDAKLGDLAADATAVPEALRGAFKEEPLYLDLRWARDDSHLGLQHAQFRDAIAQLAAPMHGVSKDELEGEDVRQHRRVRWVRRVAVATVLLLTMVASLTGLLAQHNADRATASAVEAQRQQKVAAEQQGNATRSAQEAQRQEQNARTQEARASTAAAATKLQEKRAREQQGVAERAAAEADRQLKNARRQQQLAKRAEALAKDQKAIAQEQSKLAQQAAKETAGQKILVEQQQRLAKEAVEQTERQKHIARQQQLLAEAAAADARRQEAIARDNERKAKIAAEEARRQEKNAAEQKQVAISRRLLNQAKATVNNDPATALRLGIAAEKVQPGAETRGELAALVTSTRRLGSVGDVLRVAYGQNDILAFVEPDYSTTLWSAANKAEPVRLARLDTIAYGSRPVFSPDGKTLAVADGSQGFRPVLFDVSDPTHPTTIATVPAQDTAELTFSPDGQTLATVPFGGEWALWDVADRGHPALLTSQASASSGAVTFSPDGNTLVTDGSPGIVWDITDRTRPTQLATLDGIWWGAAFHPTRPLLATNDSEGNLVLWRMDDRTEPQRFSTVATRGYSASFSDDGLTLATSDPDGTARLWDMAEDVPVQITDMNDHSGEANSLSFSPDGRTLATTGVAGTMSLWTVEVHGEPKVVGRATGDAKYEMTAALTPDGRRLTTANFDGTATVWDVSQPSRPVERTTVRVHPDNLEVAAFSPAGDTMALQGAAARGSVLLTDLSDPSTPVELGALPDGPYYGRTLQFGPGGSMLAAARAYDVVVWDLADRRRPAQIAQLPLGGELIYDIAISPDSRTVAIATGRRVDLWSLADRSHPVLVKTLKGHSNRVVAVEFSPDGRTVATGSSDRTAALWNVGDQAPRRRLAILAGNAGAVWSLAFAPDGRTLATGIGNDGAAGTSLSGDAAALWDVTEPADPVRIATLKRTDLQSMSMIFHPDGRTLTTSGARYSSTHAVLWDYSALNDLRANPAGRACAVAGGGFTAQEWAAYIPEAPFQPTCTR